MASDPLASIDTMRATHSAILSLFLAAAALGLTTTAPRPKFSVIYDSKSNKTSVWTTDMWAEAGINVQASFEVEGETPAKPPQFVTLYLASSLRQSYLKDKCPRQHCQVLATADGTTHELQLRRWGCSANRDRDNKPTGTVSEFITVTVDLTTFHEIVTGGPILFSIGDENFELAPSESWPLLSLAQATRSEAALQSLVQTARSSR